MRLFTLVVLILVGVHTLHAIPQFSALTGNRCSNCHVNPSGGGQRNDLGWYSWYDVGMVPREAGAVNWLYRADTSNRYFGDMFMFGLDARVQNTRGFAEGSERVTFPMQATVYAAFTPVKAVTIEGGFNLAALRQRPNTSERVVYPGQRMGSYSILVQPDNDWPTIRVGLIRPSIGMRYDDHTKASYSYTNGTGRNNYLAPDWAEYGTEVTYESVRWLTLQAGVFGSGGLATVRLQNGSPGAPFQSVVEGNAPTLTGRAIVWPSLGKGLNAWLGASVLNNGGFTVASAFGSIGLSDAISFMTDLTHTTSRGVQQSTNVMTELMYQFSSPIYAYARYEHYATEYAGSGTNVTGQAIVLGSQLFVLPYVELRPEYRIWDTQLEGTSNRWNLQLHIFY